MRSLFFLLVFCCLSAACSLPAQETATEHTREAGRHGYAEATIYCVNGDSVTSTQKRLPLQSNMESYALSFVMEDSAVRYSVKADGDLADVDITSFPAFENAGSENAAVAGIVNTMLAFPYIDAVTLRFDGKQIAALPHGTTVDTVFSEPIDIDVDR